jgi:lipopolysaccharide transport system ATP-binding protein
LIVDEVLAVGDAKFQRKCLGRMDKVAGEGRTVLFVSHNLQAIANVCRRGLVLSHGRVCYSGTQQEALDFYLKGMDPADVLLEDRMDRLGDGSVRVTSIELRDANGESVRCVRTGESAEVRLYFESTPKAPKSEIVVGLNFLSAYDFPLFLHSSRFNRTGFGPLPQKGCFVCTIPRLPLLPGRYPVNYSVMPSCDYIRHAFELEVRHGDYYGTGELPLSTHAVAVLDAHWTLEET